MNLLFKTIVLCLLTGSVFAQTKEEPTLQDFQKQMLEMQRKLRQQLEDVSPGDPFLWSPEWKWDTTISLRFDTLFGDQGTSRGFFFSPFSQDTSFNHLFGGHMPSFDGFLPFGDGLKWTFPPQFEPPENDENSALGDPGDGLLPEERLRKESEGGAKPSEKQPAPAPKKPKIKTIRI